MVCLGRWSSWLFNELLEEVIISSPQKAERCTFWGDRGVGRVSFTESVNKSLVPACIACGFEGPGAFRAFGVYLSGFRAIGFGYRVEGIGV